MRLSVIVPVYNEAATVEVVLQKLFKVSQVFEVVVVNDGSTDKTKQILNEIKHPKLHVFHKQNGGKGSAIGVGLEKVRGDHVLIQDADLEYDPDDIPALIAPIKKKKAEVVYGSRFLGPHSNLLFWHKQGNNLLNFVVNLLYDTTLSDMETCYKVVPTALFRSLHIQSQKFDIEPEITCKILKKKIHIFEVPISYVGRDFSQGKKITWKDAFAALWVIGKLRVSNSLTSHHVLPWIKKHSETLATVVAGIFFLGLRSWPMFTGKTLFYGDNYSLMVPGKIFTAQALLRGEVPLWNANLMGGLPWLADINQSVLYVTSLFFAVWSPATALNITILSHLALTGIGMFVAAKLWIGKAHPSTYFIAALVWMFSTHITGSINNLSTIQSLAWLPWVVVASLYVGKKTWAPIVFAMVVLLQFLGGYPQHVVYSIGLAGLISTYRWWQTQNGSWGKWLLSWIATAAVTCGITAIAWLPFAEVLLRSTRMEQSLSQAAVGSLSPLMLLKVGLSYFFDKPAAGMKWGPAWSGQPNAVLYVTWLGLLTCFSTAAIRVLSFIKARGHSWLAEFKTHATWLWLFIVVVTFLFALGDSLPGFSLIQQAVPLFRVSRYPSMVLLLTNFVVALWFAEAVLNEKIRLVWRNIWQHKWRLLLLVAVVITSACIAITRNFDFVWYGVDTLLGHRLSASVFHTLTRDQVIWQVISQNLMVVAWLFVASMWAWIYRRYWLLALIIGIEMWYSTQALLIYVPRDVYPDKTVLTQAWQPPLMTQLQSATTYDPQARWLTRASNVPYTDYGAYWEAWTVRAPFSDSFVDTHEQQVADHAKRLRDGLAPDWNWVVGVPFIHGYTTLVPQGFAHVWQKTPETRINFIDRIPLTDPLLANWAVKYYVVDTWFEHTQEEQLPTGATLIATVDQPREWLTAGRQGQWLVYELPSLPRFRTSNGEAIPVADFVQTVNTMSFRTTVSEPTELIIADRFDAGWRIQVNDQETILDEYQGQSIVSLPAGMVEVHLEYRPRSVIWGAAFSAISLLLVLWFAISRHRVSLLEKSTFS